MNEGHEEDAKSARDPYTIRHRPANRVQRIRRHLEEIAASLSRGLREGIDAIAANLSEQTANILAPVLTEKLSLKAVSALADVVRSAMPDGEGVTLVVKGPKDLFERLKTQPGFEEETMKFTETTDIDLSVELGESVFVTRMSAWASSLRKVMK